MNIETLSAAILIFMIIAATVSLYMDELLSAVIALGAVGFGGSILYLLLGAPDLAITQIVVEVVSLVLLIRITISVSHSLTSRCCRKQRVFRSFLTVGGFFAASVVSLRGFARFGSSVMDRIADTPSAIYISEGIHMTGATNLVTGVLLDFRAYDTLGEATVIFTAILGGIILLRKKGIKEENV